MATSEKREDFSGQENSSEDSSRRTKRVSRDIASLRAFRESKEDAVSEPEGNDVGTVTLLSYAALFMAAGLKDLLDLVGVGSLPGIGTVITFCFSTLIFSLMAVMGKLKGRTKYKRIGVLIFGTIVEAFGFGLNFMPVETMTVFAMYFMEKAETAGGLAGTAARVIKSKV